MAAQTKVLIIDCENAHTDQMRKALLWQRDFESILIIQKPYQLMRTLAGANGAQHAVLMSMRCARKNVNLIRQIRGTNASVVVFLFSDSDDDHPDMYLAGALRMGADGFLETGTIAQSLAQSMRKHAEKVDRIQ